MKRALFFSVLLWMAGNRTLAQIPLITYGSSWKYLDNGSDQGIAWRSLSFNDDSWKTGNGKFGYGESGITTQVSYGPDANQKYVTTYFRKTIYVANPASFTLFSAGVLRDDGVAVYVNGVEVYRNNLSTGTINYLTLGKDASDNGTVTQAFPINSSAFVSGNNMIAVEIHQKTLTNADLAFDLQLSGEEPSTDQTPPVVVSINRQLPATENTDSRSLTFRVSFSEKVRGVDASDFMISAWGGNARGTLTKLSQEAASTSLSDAVKVTGVDSITYDVSIRAIAGSGVLRLDLKSSNTAITDAVGNALAGGFTNGQSYTVNTVQPRGFNSFVDLAPVSISSATRETSQAKVWNYAGKWWAVLATSGGTKVFRLDNTSWTDVLTIASATNSRADCRVVGNLAHILLFRGTSSSYFVSLEYDPVLNTYKHWAQRTSTTNVVFESGATAATLDIDATNRIWIASNSLGNMLVRWSDPPYSTFSSPVTIVTGATSNDICAVTALPGKIGVLWSNQNSRRFGFKTHADGADPAAWSADEAPAAQSAQNVGDGLGDFQLNMVVASDGTLYCAVKTAYDKNGYPTIALLVRRPNNTWDNLYPVTSSKEGDRPFVVLNEAAGKVKVFYTTHLSNSDGSRSGDILYREAFTSGISFSPPVTFISGNGTHSLIYTSSTHQTYNPAIVVLTTDESVGANRAMGVLATDETTAGIVARAETSPEEQIYELARPNPFTTSAAIDFALPESGQYSVVLYDSKGARIRVLRQGWAEAGIRNTVSVDGSKLPHGLYYVKVQVGHKTRTLKLLKR